ncbi:MAG: type II toxin-antitoxin system HicB family antitoxin, partial [Candidatus Pacebacteria bacterium]|jgi:predicted RNase H-like HicB family nuclease|nr:type II toxin-antitoxin system HicB family antitoxin [Candidatus Paceibacterota bacterium]
MKKIDLKATVWKEGRYFVSQCINVDVASFGSTKTKAMDNLREALDLYFEDSDMAKVSKVGETDIVSFSLGNA